ncbi:carbon-nitrogen hydrolase family protein [Limnochorda pilosa]|uniref:Amidohydrolase n=1 Tax=Limnochorda pilosa TaxID=1555112 RepID=A0A0K2SM82_LIMPI|nr:carbon-nitrogen hydrolase family protein [Limnochorda pilosa]BAS27939.1 amidohydrolase [Limnochorda pilosa]
MLVALAQMKASSDKGANLEAARRCVHQAAGRGARLVVFPEMFMAAPSQAQPPSALAEPLSGGFVHGLAEVARETGSFVACGVWETSQDAARPYNTAVVVDAEGGLAAAYRKLHLFDALNVQESRTMHPGAQPPPVCEVDGLRVGIGICYDLRFPEFFRDLSERGAELVILPSAWYAGSLKEDHWLTLLRARAIENTVYVAGANQVGDAFCGRSAAFDPFGVVLADAGETEELVTFDVRADRIAAVRKKLPSLAHRRRDVFA